jgi:probable phosphoglycerate mutase
VRGSAGSGTVAPCPIHSTIFVEWVGNLHPQLALLLEERFFQIAHRPVHWKAMNGNLFDDPGSADTAEVLIAHCDGGSRGNPGPSGFGAVIEDSKGRTLAELSEFLGIQTNNYAEYSGLLAVLKWAIENGTKHLRVVSDSELMVKQMQGKYAVKSPVLKPLFDEAKKMARRIPSFEMRHTLRGGNKVADRLANEAMDRGMGKKQGIGNREQGIENRGQGSGVRDQGAGGRPVAPAARPYGKLESTPIARPVPQTRPVQAPAAAKPARQVLEGYVKGGVVHLLEGELPEGIFVKVIRE